MVFAVGVFSMRTVLLLKQAAAGPQWLWKWNCQTEVVCRSLVESLSISDWPHLVSPPLYLSLCHPTLPSLTDIFSSTVLLHCVVQAISWSFLKHSMEFSLWIFYSIWMQIEKWRSTKLKKVQAHKKWLNSVYSIMNKCNLLLPTGVNWYCYFSYYS